jgi:hypothetical protein
MMWPNRIDEFERIKKALRSHSANTKALPGIAGQAELETLAHQFVASLRREDYYAAVQKKEISKNRADPTSATFDAERAVAYHLQQGDVEEAAWLVFLMTHFARPADTGWLRLKDVYSKLGKGKWDWKTVEADPSAFANWVYANSNAIRGKFGNHRKYESLKPNAKRRLLKVVQSYLAWIGAAGQEIFFAKVVQQTGNDPAKIFDALYRSMTVFSFGRLAKFDYLALIGRYSIAPIAPGSAYLAGATGPAYGARRLFTGNPKGSVSLKTLQSWLDDLDTDLGVGMSVMEDALCNWQKSPAMFVHFKG